MEIFLIYRGKGGLMIKRIIVLNRVILLFIIYSFLGWIVETSFILLTRQHFVERGLLKYGLPLIPLYGFCSMFIIKLLSPLKNRPLLLTFEAVCSASIIEYVIGLIERNIFHVKTWDYTNLPFSIYGIISLPISLGWGILSLIMIYWLDEKLKKVIYKFPAFPTAIISWIIMVYSLICIGISLNNLI